MKIMVNEAAVHTELYSIHKEKKFFKVWKTSSRLANKKASLIKLKSRL